MNFLTFVTVRVRPCGVLTSYTHTRVADRAFDSVLFFRFVDALDVTALTILSSWNLQNSTPIDSKASTCSGSTSYAVLSIHTLPVPSGYITFLIVHTKNLT